MSNILAPFPDLVVASLDLALQEMADVFTSSAQTGSQTPADLEEHLPFLRVERVGGNNDRITNRGAYDWDLFSATYSEGMLLALALEQLVLGYPHRVASTGVIIDSGATETAPRELPWENGAVRRFGGTYHLSARR